MMFTAQDHPHNAPDTWVVVKINDRCWHLMDKDQRGVIELCLTKKGAEMARTVGSSATLYDMERRWYAGEKVANWKDYTP